MAGGGGDRSTWEGRCPLKGDDAAGAMKRAKHRHDKTQLMALAS